MLGSIGTFFAERFRRWLPDSYIFALILTLIAALWALFAVDVGPVKIAEAWYKGFWILLKFAMQMVLILVTGYAIAISPIASRFIDWVANKINSPLWVYASVLFVGQLFSLISWGWVVMTAVLARELTMRVKGVDYRLSAAAVYAAFLPWHGGLSGSIPLVLNTPENFLIKAGVLSEIIPTTLTLGSPMNIVISLALLFTLPMLFMMMRPSEDKLQTFDDLCTGDACAVPVSVEEEANSLNLPDRCISDMLNSSWIISGLVVLMGLYIIVSLFYAKGFDINLNIMNFLFIILGMMAHKTPIRCVVAMKRACANVSGIILQFPFYAGIMGIMIYTGLGKQVATSLAAATSPGSFPIVAAGSNLQARDIMGYTFVALLWSFVIFGLGVTFLPM